MATRNIGEQFVEDGAQKVTDQEVTTVVSRSDEIKKKFGSGGPLHRFIEDGRHLLSMVRDYRSGQYRQIPYATVAAAVFALIYVLNPLDLIPDFLPIIGQVDDAAVVAACLLLIERDLRAYQRWQAAQPGNS